MAVKTLKEAIDQAGLAHKMKSAYCKRPAYDIVSTLEAESEQLTQDIMNELRDYFAHEVMKFNSKEAASIECEKHLNSFFEKIFKGIPVFKGMKQ